MKTCPMDFWILWTANSRVQGCFFSRQNGPWGFWKPVRDSLAAKGTPVEENKDFARDMINVTVGIIWQTALICVPIFLVIRDWPKFLIALVIAIATSVFLKIYWYDNMRDYPEGYTTPETAS